MKNLQHTLNAMCSKKWATPFVCSVSYLDPASIQRPTVAVGAPVSSVATLRPEFRVVVLVGGTFTSLMSGAADVERQRSGAWQKNNDSSQTLKYGRADRASKHILRIQRKIQLHFQLWTVLLVYHKLWNITLEVITQYLVHVSSTKRLIHFCVSC